MQRSTAFLATTRYKNLRDRKKPDSPARQIKLQPLLNETSTLKMRTLPQILDKGRSTIDGPLSPHN